MIRIFWLAVILGLAGATQSALASSCLDPSIPRGESSSSIRLTMEIVGPYFYFRGFDYNFAILVTQNSIHNVLESASSKGNKDARGLLNLIAKDLPLVQNTDLFKYVLLDSYQLSTIQRVLVELIGNGDVAVFDAETGHLSPQIELRRENSEHARRRTFYNSNKEILIQSLDCIED